MRNFIREMFWLCIELPLCVLFLFDYFVLWPIFVILKNIRIEIFGPRLCKKLVRDAEKMWAEEHPNWPKETMSNGLTLCCEGACWEYKDGKWQIRPKRIGLTRCGAHLCPDGKMIHYEEWINEKGEVERKEWQLPN